MSDTARTFDTVRTATREWAGREHAKTNQTWGDGKPYLEHLDAVEAVLVRFGFDKPKSLEHQTLRIAAFAHDLIEDTAVTQERVLWYLGPEVEALVAAVTDEPGENRAARHLKTYPKIRDTPLATILKLADRTANVEESIRTGHSLLNAYQKEHPGFRAALCVKDPAAAPLWEHLDGLLGYSPGEPGEAQAAAEGVSATGALPMGPWV